VNWVDVTGLVPGVRYDTAAEAVLEAAIWIQIIAVDHKRLEYAGLIYRDCMGDECGYFHTDPYTMNSSVESNPWMAAGDVPSGHVEVACYHSHPTGEPKTLPNDASSGDRDWARFSGDVWMIQFDASGAPRRLFLQPFERGLPYSPGPYPIRYFIDEFMISSIEHL
jgi:hypothetical protein